MASGEVCVSNVPPTITNFFIEEVGLSTVETEFTIRCEVSDANGRDDLMSATYKVSLGSSPRYHGELVHDGSDEYHAPPFTLGAGDSGTWRVCVEVVDDDGAKGSLLHSFGYRTDGGIPFIPSSKLRKFSVRFIAWGPSPKTEFVLGERILLHAHVEDAATGELTGADVAMWYIDLATRIMCTVPTVELGEGVYEGEILSSELGVGTFQAGVDVQLAGFRGESDQLTFTVAEPPVPIWELPAFWAALFAGFVGLLIAVDIKRRPQF